MALTASQLTTLTDYDGQTYVKALGNASSDIGLGDSSQAIGSDWGVSKNVRNQIASALAFQSVDFLSYISALNSTATRIDAASYVAGVLQPEYNALVSLCASSGISGVSSLDTYCSYYNTGAGGPWSALLSPDFRTLYGILNVGSYPSPWNVYFEVLQGTTYTNGLRKLVVGGSQTAGQDIDPNKYAGGFGQVKWTGVTGSGSASVTGTWRKTDGSTQTGDGAAAIAGASGTAVLTPPFPNALLLSVTNISVTGLSAGTIYVEAKRPTGR
jgi:hypothetical protein